MLKKMFTDELAVMLERLIAKPMQAAADNRYMKAVQAGSGIMLYGFFAASVFGFAALFPLAVWQQNIAPLKTQLLFSSQLIIGLSGIIGAFGASFNLAKHYAEHNRKLVPLAIALYSTLSFILTLPWLTNNGIISLDLAAIGAGGFFGALIIGIVSVELFRLVHRSFGKITAPSIFPGKVLPTFFNPLCGLAVLALWWLVKFVIFANFLAFIFLVLQPLVELFATPWVAGAIFLFDRLLWQFGIHGSTLIGALMSPLWAKMSLDNITSVTSGGKVLHICSAEFINYYPRVSLLPAILARIETLHRVAGEFGPVFQLGLGGDVVAAFAARLEFEFPAPDGTDAVLFGVGDGVGGADKDAGAAADAGLGLLGEGGGHPLFRGAEGHGNGAHPHHLPAGADALGAQDTPGRGVPFLKAGFVNAHGRGHLLEVFRGGRLGQKEFHDHAPGGEDFLRRGLDH